MAENNTFEAILNAMLARVPTSIDKREGSFIYDSLAPTAVELQNMYIYSDYVFNETFADTASRENLIRRAAERGITIQPATNAIVKGEFTPNTLEIPIGARFSLDEFNYSVTEKISDGIYKLQCEETGADANFKFGQLIQIDYINGLQYAEIVEVLIPGEDEESTESLRKRYFANLENQAFGGNITDYKQKVNSLSGIGGVKVYPVWNGGGTVKLVIINSDFQKPSDELISMTQTAIDPIQNQGQGLGIAPIGHVVTVAGVNETVLNIASEFTLQNGYQWADVEANIKSTIKNYFDELNSTWADSENLIVRISQLETRLLNLDGIIDIANTKINNVAENFVLSADSIAILGEVNNIAT